MHAVHVRVPLLWQCCLGNVHANNAVVKNFTCVPLLQPVQSLADRYARRLKSRERVSEVLRIRDSEDMEEASISEQAEALQVRTLGVI